MDVKPRIPREELTRDEKRFVAAVLNDEEFVGEKIEWEEASKTFTYKIAKKHTVEIGPPEAVPRVEVDSKGRVVFEEAQHVSTWRVYESGGTPIRAYVFEDAALGRYGELSRARIRASALKVETKIDLSCVQGLPGIALTNCSLSGLDFCESTMVCLKLPSTVLGKSGLRADNLSVTGSVFLDKGFEAHGPVNISGSTIGGVLQCANGKFLHSADNCLRADRLKVTESVFLNKGFVARGPVEINGSTIGGGLECGSGKFLCSGDNCLRADDLNVTGSVFLDQGFVALGPVRINGSTIGGGLQCGSGKFLHSGDSCLRADDLKVTGSVFLNKGFEAYGPVEINGSTIGGVLQCDNGKFLHSGDDCLRAFGLNVTGNVFLDQGFEAHGPVDINGSTIGGGLQCANGKFLHSGDDCLRAFGLNVTGNVFLNAGFEALGPVEIYGSTIGGGLQCANGKFLHSGDNCLRAFGLNVTGNVFLNAGFEALGPVEIYGSTIGGGLTCANGKFSSLILKWARMMEFVSDASTKVRETLDMRNAEVTATTTLNGSITRVTLEDATLKGTLTVSAGCKIEEEIDLTEAKIDKFDDRNAVNVPSLPSKWLEAGNFWLKTCICDLLGKPPTESGPDYKLAGVQIASFDPMFLHDTQRFFQFTAKDHALGNWIGAADGGVFHADVYDSIALTLVAQGKPELAKYLLIRKNRHRRKHLGWWARLWGIVAWDIPIAYGYRSWQVVVPLLFSWLICFCAVDANKEIYSPVGANRTVAVDIQKSNWKSPKPAPPVTLSIPGVQLSVAESSPSFVVDQDCLRKVQGPGFVPFSPAMYALDHLVPIISFNQKANWDVDRTETLGSTLVVGQWLATILGWVLTSLFVTSLTGIIKNRF